MALREESDERAEPTEAIRPGVVTALLARLAGGATVERDAPLAPGARVARYEVIRPVGYGAFGAVYEAHDLALHRLVALKVLRPSRMGSREDAIEGEAAARLAHPNIAALHDAGVVDGAPYLVYELLHGETLESRLARGPLRPREAVDVAIGIARALAHAHAHGVVHRDLKPANVFLTADGEVKVLDFGVALLFGRAGPSGGTPAYMAPEQRRREAEDARTDLYALGLLLVEMLTGTPPTPAAVSGDRVPRAIRPVLASLLADDPGARPRAARAAAAALEAARDAAPGGRWRRVVVGAIALALVALATALLLRQDGARPRAPGLALPSIAVLPFADMSPQKDQEYFSDGLAEEILNALTQVEGLHVAGRTSSFSFKGRTDDLGTIAAKLHVTSLLAGSVRKAGDRVRITAQLVDTANGYHLWSQTYDRELGDVFAVQDDIARSVVEALRVKLLPAAGAAPRARRTVSAAAYEQVLVGLDLRRRLSPDSWRRAIGAFERAVALDPDYARAWAELANALYWRANELTRGAEIDDLKRRAAEAAERGVALDPGLAEAYAVRGLVRATARHWSAAKEDLDRALALSPGSADVRWNRATAVLLPLGRFDDAIAELRRAADLDPLWPQAWAGLGLGLVARGDTAEARSMYARALELAPDAEWPRHGVVLTLVLEGRGGDAGPFLRAPVTSLDLMDHALVRHALGDRAGAQQALDGLVVEGADAAAFQVAEVYAWRGERERAFAWLERAFAQRDAGVAELRTSPFLRPLRDDPRFAALLRRLDQPD